MWLQEDGAPQHSAFIVREFLNLNFNERWIGRRSIRMAPQLAGSNLQVTLKIDLKVMMVKVMYTLTFHRLLWSILNVCLLRKTKALQEKYIWLFLRHLNFILYLSKVTKTIFPQAIFDVKFPALFKSAVKNRGSHLRKGSCLHLTLKIDLKVKIDGTVKCPPRSWSTFVRPFFRKWSILEDIWDYKLKWVTVYIDEIWREPKFPEDFRATPSFRIQKRSRLRAQPYSQLLLSSHRQTL